jgi:tetratricopeptide (TPR) repeat protein
MKIRRLCIIWLTCLLLIPLGCGPDSIFIRQGLDTPSHHVNNGNQFMDSGKFDAAREEFNRAIELDPNYVPAYVGLGLVTGHDGNPEKGMEIMAKARELARDEEQRKNVEAGFEILRGMTPSD